MHEQQVIIVLKALADPTRLDIVRTLAREAQGASCRNVSHCSSLSQPAMSHHFSKLADAGVITERKDGKEKFYELNLAQLEAVGIDAHRL